jgi:hypothetical protein
MRSACPISFDLCADAGLLLALFDVRRSTRFFCSDRSNSGESALETALLTRCGSHRVTVIRLTETMEYPSDRLPGSLWLDARELDHLGPLLNVFGNELAEFGG